MTSLAITIILLVIMYGLFEKRNFKGCFIVFVLLSAFILAMSYKPLWYVYGSLVALAIIIKVVRYYMNEAKIKAEGKKMEEIRKQEEWMRLDREMKRRQKERDAQKAEQERLKEIRRREEIERKKWPNAAKK